jgi:predicted transcriptional regulator
MNMHNGMHKRYATEPQGKKGTQEEIAELLGVSQQWVSKYDLKSLESCETLLRRGNLGKSMIPEG